MAATTDTSSLPVGRSLPDWTPTVRPRREAMAGRYARLKPLVAVAHAAELFAANGRDKTGALWTYLGYGPFADFEAYLNWMDKTCGGEDTLFFAIIDNTTGRAVGVAAYLRIDPANGVIEIGHLAFSPDLQRTAVATDAMYLMMETVFTAGYRRCEWKCDSLNAPSRAAAERLGFTFEGVFRQAAVVKGCNRDTAWYAIIDSDWPDIRAAFQRWLAPENFDNNGRQLTRLAARRGGG